MDLSLAPTPAVGDSVAHILEEIGLSQCGGHGTTAALAMLNDAVKNVINYTDLPVYEVFKMASLNPANAIHCSERIGSLEEGKDADIIITDKDINVKRTIKKGKTIYEA